MARSSLLAVALLAGAALVIAAPPAHAATAGATTPFTSYEAEAGALGGGASTVALTAAPATQYSSAALEASGHAYVHLAAAGQRVTWSNTTGRPISAIVVRASIPDSAAGGGITASLSLYVDGAYRQALSLTSKQSWVYEGNNHYNDSADQNPADGNPRVFWDEARAFTAPIAPGATFALQKDAADTAAFYDIDVVDVENPAPISQPAGSISITSCGAADSPDVDSTGPIQTCINQAQAQNKVLWIPSGTFYLKGTAGLHATGITIAGAGPWYSTIYRAVPLPNPQPLGAVLDLTSCTVRDFHIDSNATSRATVDGAGGAMDTTGTNWVADDIWTQHTLSGFWASGTGGQVRNSRLTSIWADGINLNNVSLNSSVGNNLSATNNFVRGTGDDGMAINSVNYNTDANGNRTYYTPMANISFTRNTIVAPWGGKGIGIYGGSGHDVEYNAVSDTARYIGLGAGRFGVNGSDLLGATVSNNVVTRSGGNGYSQGQPALQIGNGGDGQNVGVVDRVTAAGNTVTGSLYDGIGFSQSTNTQLLNNTVTAPGRNGVVVAPPFYPAPSGSATITGNTVTGLKSGASAYLNNSAGFAAILSANSWQGGSGPVEAPFGGTAAAVPGTVQAEHYDTGGPGLAYSVTSVNGTANGYRADGVDLESTSDTGGGYNLGWTGAGQWFRYTVNVATAGQYTVSARVAAPSAVTGALHIADAAGANLTGAVSLPATGGWQAWGTATATLTLPAGRQVLTVVQDTGGWNLNSLQFTAGGSTPPPTNLAAGRPTAESSHNQVYASGNVTDGNQGTYWESANNAFPQWVQVDLGAARSATKVVLQLPPGWGARTQTLTLSASNDGSAFTTVVPPAGYTFSPSATITFNAATARYWRVTVTANTGWPAAQLAEFQIWG
ncbi:discoidin domain-containing protein [Dactylosporangium matsuzakiense]|uniref:Mycodextranase n=1 Tax=Dactylosporangium matsuzakiense TaxID=53360 RepID=A0A9W6KQ54_9ACTN|nr:discoidin domain-containing protein [Dactylosporangium matsuzakiense]UWZ47445.1 discoidin domain-containing protein [Dactylosporangium matsuzakiense]GLL05197.1 mycodextranase [Dactylosporangium matsuzakiense]